MTIYYFDNAATTRPYEEVINAVADYERCTYANPSSLHKFGSEANKAVAYASENILNILGLKGNYKVIFTSGATESANLAIKGVMEKYRDISKTHLISTVFEHACVSEVCNYYVSKGADADFVHVNSYGTINVSELLSYIKPNTKLVSFIWVNNETGSLQPAQKLIKGIKESNPDTLVHIDATQGFGKVKADLSGADMITISGHKFHAPKGVGALIVKEKLVLSPVLHGGGQQEGVRSGTINAPSIYGIGKACEIILSHNVTAAIRENQEYLYQKLSASFGEGAINTKIYEAEYAPHIISVSFEGLKSEVLLHMLEEKNIFVSSGSACSSHKKHSSVISSLGIGEKRADGTIRISLSEFNTKEEIDYLCENLTAAVKRLRGLTCR